jgi:hypothetical protein
LYLSYLVPEPYSSGDDIDEFSRTLAIVSPRMESFKDHEFLVMGIIVELQSHQGPGIKSYWMKFLVQTYNGKYSGDSIV